MTSIWWVPRSRGGRIRLITLGFGLLLVGMAPAQLVHSTDNQGATVIALVAIGLLLGILLATALVRRQVSVWEAPATAVLTVLVGVGLESPLNVMSVMAGVIVAQGLYGGLMSELLRVAALLPVVPLTVALSASSLAQELEWYSPQTLAMLPFVPLFAVLVHLTKSALQSQAEVKRRARFMATLTGDLLASTTLERAVDVLQSAVTELCRLTPGSLVVAVSRQQVAGGEAAWVRVVIGEQVTDPPAEIPPGIIERLPALSPDSIREVDGIGRRMAAIGLPPDRKWLAQQIEDDLEGQDVNLVLWGLPVSLPERLLGITSSRSNELVDVLRLIGVQRSTTFAYLAENQDLVRAAARDDVTGLTRRPAFLADLDRLLAGREPVALLLVGLDGLIPLTVQHGLPVASMVASRLARRLGSVVGERGVTGRFSDRRFAVAVPVPAEPDAPDVMAELADVLRRVLSEPVRAGGQDVRLTVGIGIARSAGISGADEQEPARHRRDLLERAAGALRADITAAAQPLVSPA